MEFQLVVQQQINLFPTLSEAIVSGTTVNRESIDIPPWIRPSWTASTL
jgi:hypothetical protein